MRFQPYALLAVVSIGAVAARQVSPEAAVAASHHPAAAAAASPSQPAAPSQSKPAPSEPSVPSKKAGSKSAQDEAEKPAAKQDKSTKQAQSMKQDKSKKPEAKKSDKKTESKSASQQKTAKTAKTADKAKRDSLTLLAGAEADSDDIAALGSVPEFILLTQKLKEVEESARTSEDLARFRKLAADIGLVGADAWHAGHFDTIIGNDGPGKELVSFLGLGKVLDTLTGLHARDSSAVLGLSHNQAADGVRAAAKPDMANASKALPHVRRHAAPVNSDSSLRRRSSAHAQAARNSLESTHEATVPENGMALEEEQDGRSVESEKKSKFSYNRNNQFKRSGHSTPPTPPKQQGATSDYGHADGPGSVKENVAAAVGNLLKGKPTA